MLLVRYFGERHTAVHPLAPLPGADSGLPKAYNRSAKVFFHSVGQFPCSSFYSPPPRKKNHPCTVASHSWNQKAKPTRTPHPRPGAPSALPRNQERGVSSSATQLPTSTANDADRFNRREEPGLGRPSRGLDPVSFASQLTRNWAGEQVNADPPRSIWTGTSLIQH